MGFFRSIGNALARFMYGRNRMDQLGVAMLWAGLLVNVVSMLVQRHFRFLAMLLYWVSMALWIVILFRMFSKNLPKRQAENQSWISFVQQRRARRAGAKARHSDKDHKYFTCQNCHTVCRVPVGKGNIVITCPKCGAEIHGKT